jgi:hypothetical protein
LPERLGPLLLSAITAYPYNATQNRGYSRIPVDFSPGSGRET